MKPQHITVTAPEGRRTPINPALARCQDGAPLLFVEHNSVVRLPYEASVRRAIRRGDLIPCDMNGKDVDAVHAAASEQPFETGNKIWPKKRQAAEIPAAKADAPAATQTKEGGSK